MRKRSSVASICSSIAGTGSPVLSRELGDVLAAVAVLGRLLPAPRSPRPTRGTVHLRARVVVVVLALDLVARELEQPRDRVADRRRCAPTRP